MRTKKRSDERKQKAASEASTRKTKSQLQQQLKNYFVFSNENLTKPSASLWALPLKHSPHYSPPRNNSLSQSLHLFPPSTFPPKTTLFLSVFFFCFLSPITAHTFLQKQRKTQCLCFLKVFSLKSVLLKQE